MKTAELDDRILLLLSDGEPCPYGEIFDAVFERFTHYAQGQFCYRIKTLMEGGYIVAKRYGNVNFYTVSGNDFSAVRVDPDALLGKPFDVTKLRRDAVMELLDDGEARTAEQLSNAYFSKVRNPKTYTTQYKHQLMIQTCEYLHKWGRVEKVEIYKGVLGWRAVA